MDSAQIIAYYRALNQETNRLLEEYSTIARLTEDTGVWAQYKQLVGQAHNVVFANLQRKINTMALTPAQKTAARTLTSEINQLKHDLHVEKNVASIVAGMNQEFAAELLSFVESFDKSWTKLVTEINSAKSMTGITVKFDKVKPCICAETLSQKLHNAKVFTELKNSVGSSGRKTAGHAQTQISGIHSNLIILMDPSDPFIPKFKATSSKFSTVIGDFLNLNDVLNRLGNMDSMIEKLIEVRMSLIQKTGNISELKNLITTIEGYRVGDKLNKKEIEAFLASGSNTLTAITEYEQELSVILSNLNQYKV
jgi:cell fate (sporulation/competence/biofilm development) regulator YlbF (YheA/YmcA/DUF963 family)